MEKLKKIVIFALLPAAIIALQFVSASVVSQRYTGASDNWAQYNSEISISVDSIVLKPGQSETYEVTTKNNGTMTWISSGDHPIFLAYRIRNSSEKNYLSEGERIVLPEAVKPGESLTLMVEVESPLITGEYLIVFDMIHEGVAWFADKGADPLNIILKVIE